MFSTGDIVDHAKLQLGYSKGTVRAARDRLFTTIRADRSLLYHTLRTGLLLSCTRTVLPTAHTYLGAYQPGNHRFHFACCYVVKVQVWYCTYYLLRTTVLLLVGVVIQ